LVDDRDHTMQLDPIHADRQRYDHQRHRLVLRRSRPWRNTHRDRRTLRYARSRTIAVSPTSPLPHHTRFHELAHVLLGHTTEGEQNDGALTPRNLRECEAEAVAMRCCAALGLPGVEFSGISGTGGGLERYRGGPPSGF
jgi:IrrE N-terminal-like domain